VAVHGPTYRPRTISTTIAKAIPVTVRVALSRRARVTIRRALRARKRMVMQLHVRVADDAGNTRTLTRQIALELRHVDEAAQAGAHRRVEGLARTDGRRVRVLDESRMSDVVRFSTRSSGAVAPVAGSS
jgi:hypothetical protein